MYSRWTYGVHILFKTTGIRAIKMTKMFSIWFEVFVRSFAKISWEIYRILVFLLPENYQFESYFRTAIKFVSLSSFNIVTQILIGNYFDSDYYRQCQLNWA